MADDPDQGEDGEVNEKEVADALEAMRPEEEPNWNTLPWTERANFSVFMGLIIVANALVIGIEADDQKQNVMEGKSAISDRMKW